MSQPNLKKEHSMLQIFAVLTIAFTFTLSAQTQQEAAVTVTIVPSAQSGGPDKTEIIAGTVTGKCDECSIILYAKAGDVWYVQPQADAVYTTIRDGKWSNETHLGTQYAAILAKRDFIPPAKTLLLPKVGDRILGVTIVDGRR